MVATAPTRVTVRLSKRIWRKHTLALVRPKLDFGNAKKCAQLGTAKTGGTPVMVSKAEASKIQESGPGSKPKSASAADVSPQNGLTSDEAHSRLEKFGLNAMPDTSVHPLRMALEKFWAPVPWMLEAAMQNGRFCTDSYLATDALC
jgi:hypothetical protein